MKRLAFVAAVLAVSACSKADNAAKDTTPPAMAPAPAPAATSDSAMKADSAHKMDSTMKADSMKKADSAKAAKTFGCRRTVRVPVMLLADWVVTWAPRAVTA